MARNPMRCVDWRWQRAVGIVAGIQPAPSRALDTPEGASWIRRACVLKRWLDQCRDEFDQAQVATRLADLFFAYSIWNTAGQWRWYAEAYLLAGCTDEEIARKLGAESEVIRAYEALFFNVRDRLSSSGYILNAVLGPAIHRGISEREYDLLWKLYGYLYGPYMLDALVSRTVAPARCTNADGVVAALKDDAVGNVLLAASQAGKSLKLSPRTNVELLNIFTKFVEIERTTEDLGHRQEQVLTAIGTVLNNISFTVAGRDPRQGQIRMEPPDVLAEYRNAGVELTTEEALRLEAGQPVPRLEEVKTLKFPEPEAFAVQAS